MFVLKELMKLAVIFAGHILGGMIVFSIVGAGALGLQSLAHVLKDLGADDIIVSGMHWLEYLYFACDFLAASTWTIMSTVKFIKDLKELLK